MAGIVTGGGVGTPSGFPEPIDSARNGPENTQWGNLTLQTATPAAAVVNVSVDAPYHYLDEDEQMGLVSLDKDFMQGFSAVLAPKGLPRPDFLHRAPTGWPVLVDVEGAGMQEITLRYEDVPHILAGRDDKSYVMQVLIEYETEDDE